MEIEENNKRSYLNVIKWIIPVLLFCFFVLMILFTPAFQDSAFKVKSMFTGYQFSDETTSGGIDKLELRSQRNINSIESKLESLKPVKPYIVVNTTENRYSLRNAGGDTVRTGGCSTGKNEVLIAVKK
jgi:hypothetical protein